MVDSHGNVVILRGVNVHDALSQSLTDDDFKRIASWGFNAIRLPIAWANMEPGEGSFDISYLTSVDNYVELAQKYGMYVILDMHQYKWSPDFSYFGQPGYGMPSWLVSGYPDDANGYDQVITDFWLGKGANRTVPSTNNPSMQDFFIEAWRTLTKRYRLNATVAIYELFNEPYYSTNIDPLQMPSCLYPFYTRLIEAIREIDSRHIIAYEPTGGWDSGRAQKLNFTNLAFTFHLYPPDIYDGNATTLRSEFMYRYSPPYDWQSKPSTWNLPIYLGEFKTDVGPQNPNCSRYIQDLRQILDNQVGIGWFWWMYGKSDSHGYELLYANGAEKSELTDYLKIA
jgi:endoglycosylceramidase